MNSAAKRKPLHDFEKIGGYGGTMGVERMGSVEPVIHKYRCRVCETTVTLNGLIDGDMMRLSDSDPDQFFALLNAGDIRAL